MTGKGGKVDGFPLAKLSKFSLAALSQQVPRPARRRLVSAHRGELPAPKQPARVLFSSQHRHCPADPGPWPGTPARWGATRDREASCAGRGCLSAWGLVAGVGVAISRSAVLGFLSATNPAAVKLIDAFRSHYSAPALLSATDTLYRHAIERGEKMAVHMGGYQCRL